MTLRLGAESRLDHRTGRGTVSYVSELGGGRRRRRACAVLSAWLQSNPTVRDLAVMIDPVVAVVEESVGE